MATTTLIEKDSPATAIILLTVMFLILLGGVLTLAYLGGVFTGKKQGIDNNKRIEAEAAQANDL